MNSEKRNDTSMVVHIVVTVVRRALLIFPAMVFAYLMYLRSIVSYTDYVEDVVGAWSQEALARAKNPLIEDVPLWATAQHGFWLDLLTVATGPIGMSVSLSASIVIALAVTLTMRRSSPASI